MTGDEARKREPNLVDAITKVLSFPTTAVIYPWEVAIACMQVAIGNGAELFLNHEVKSISKSKQGYTVKAGDKEFSAKVVVNASGTGAEEICKMITDQVGFQIKPRRGEYFVIEKDVHIAHNVIFPVPTEKGKGVLAVPTVYGNTLIGPNSEPIDEVSIATSDDGIKYIKDNITRILKEVPLNKAIRTFAGVRPSSTSKDFIIEPLGEDNPNFINIASIESPGLASSPGITEYVIDKYIKDRLELELDPDAVMTRKGDIVMAQLTDEEKNAVIKENPQYGNMVCRCEKISEGEIVAAINAVCGARSVKGVKKRVRPGMGKCQGGFCEPKVVEILARELNCSPVDVVLDRKKSKILGRENR